MPEPYELRGVELDGLTVRTLGVAREGTGKMSGAEEICRALRDVVARGVRIGEIEEQLFGTALRAVATLTMDGQVDGEHGRARRSCGLGQVAHTVGERSARAMGVED